LYRDGRCISPKAPIICKCLDISVGVKPLFRKVELLNEAQLTIAVGVAVARLHINPETPPPQVNAEIRTTLTNCAGDQPALIDRAPPPAVSR